MALTQRELKVAQEASASCQSATHGVLTHQNAALSQLQEGFAQRMSNGQVRDDESLGQKHRRSAEESHVMQSRSYRMLERNHHVKLQWKAC